MDTGNLDGRCARCANRCRVRLVTDDAGIVVEARRQVPGRQTTYEACPNLDKNVGTDAGGLVEAGLVRL